MSLSTDLWFKILQKMHTHDISKFYYQFFKNKNNNCCTQKMQIKKSIKSQNKNNFKKALCKICKLRFPHFFLLRIAEIDVLLWQIFKNYRCGCGERSIKWYSYSSYSSGLYKKLQQIVNQKRNCVLKISKNVVFPGICINCIKLKYCTELSTLPQFIVNTHSTKIYSNFNHEVLEINNKIFLMQKSKKNQNIRIYLFNN